MTNRIVAAIVFALFACPARAHHFMDGDLPRTFIEGLLSGLGHPLIGLDHAVFIVAAGFLLALVSRGIWGIAALIFGSLCGAGLHLAGVNLPAAEAGVALSVMLIGVVVMARRRMALTWLVAGLALAGLFHGHAYAEAIFGAEASPLVAYLIGFSVTQCVIAITAYRAHRFLIENRELWLQPVSAALGAMTGVTGLIYLIINTAG